MRRVSTINLFISFYLFYIYFIHFTHSSVGTITYNIQLITYQTDSSYKMQEEDHNSKVQRIALELNKNGLSYLGNEHGSSSAFDYFKKAQKLLNAEVQIDSSKKNIQRLLAVTFNNLAIYYKRTNKPKAALSYLKNALEIETFALEDWLATATTHLNICAIYSYMGKHQEAVDHANLSIENASKAKTQANTKQNQGKDPNFDKSCSNIELASLYNLAVEYEHLKRYQEAIETYKKSKQTAKNLGRKNIQTNSQQSIERLSSELTKNRKKIIQLLQKKKQNEQKGNYDSMRRNKKNYKSHLIDQQQQGVAVKIAANKYNQYSYIDSKKRTQSVSKLVTLRPLRSHSTEGIKKIKENTGRKEAKGGDKEIEQDKDKIDNKNGG